VLPAQQGGCTGREETSLAVALLALMPEHRGVRNPWRKCVRRRRDSWLHSVLGLLIKNAWYRRRQPIVIGAAGEEDIDGGIGAVCATVGGGEKIEELVGGDVEDVVVCR
jgi:hypothetical protein